MDEMPNACIRRDRDRKMLQPVTMFNRTSFSQYHRLGSSIRLIPDKTGEGVTAPSLANTEVPAPATTAVAAASSSDSAAPGASDAPAASTAPTEARSPALDPNSNGAAAAEPERETGRETGTAPSAAPSPALSLPSAAAPTKAAATQVPVAQPSYHGVLPKPSSPYRINLE